MATGCQIRRTLPAEKEIKQQAALTVYGLPYAGGNAYAYRPLEKHLPAGMRLVGIELPGRGMRAREPLLSSLEALADDVFAQLRPQLASGDYALFGHSMGAALGFLCLQRILEAGLPAPLMLFLSGKQAPSCAEERTRHLLSREAFVAMLRELGGCPPEILAEAELIDYFEPILRADFQAVETWRPTASAPVPVPLTVLHGRDDAFSRDDALAWAQETVAGFLFHEFAGEHFFIQQHWPEIARLLAETLTAARSVNDLSAAVVPAARGLLADA